MTPQRNIAQSEAAPPEIEHSGVASEYSFAGHAWRSGHEFCQPVKHAAALRFVLSRKQVPQRERVLRAGLG